MTTTAADSQWTTPKEAIDSVNRSTVAFLESAAKLCVDRVPAMASLLSYKARTVDAVRLTKYKLFLKFQFIARIASTRAFYQSRS